MAEKSVEEYRRLLRDFGFSKKVIDAAIRALEKERVERLKMRSQRAKDDEDE